MFSFLNVMQDILIPQKHHVILYHLETVVTVDVNYVDTLFDYTVLHRITCMEPQTTEFITKRYLNQNEVTWTYFSFVERANESSAGFSQFTCAFALRRIKSLVRGRIVYIHHCHLIRLIVRGNACLN